MCCIQQHPRQISSLRSLDLVHEVGYPWNWRDERIPARPLNYLNCFAKNSRTFRFGSSVGSIFSRCWNGSGVELLTTHYSKLLLLARQLTVLKCGCKKTFYSWRETARVAASKRTKQKSILKKIAVFNQKSPTRVKKNSCVTSKAFGRNE